MHMKASKQRLDAALWLPGHPPAPVCRLQVQLASLRFFEHGRSCTLWVDPESEGALPPSPPPNPLRPTPRPHAQHHHNRPPSHRCDVRHMPQRSQHAPSRQLALRVLAAP